MWSPSQQTCCETATKPKTISRGSCGLVKCRFWHSSLLWLTLPSAGGRMWLQYRNNQTSSLASTSLCKVKFSIAVAATIMDEEQRKAARILPNPLCWVGSSAWQWPSQPASLSHPPCGTGALPCPALTLSFCSLPTLRAATWKTQELAGRGLYHHEKVGGNAHWFCPTMLPSWEGEAEMNPLQCEQEC